VTIDCSDVHQRMWEFLDAELELHEIATVTRHLAGCSGCRGATAYDRALLDLLGRQRAVVPPARVLWQVKVALRSVH
jgi:predicted anti-sigma-YlaC factor YlaD